jgi:hypothetical protein
VYDGGLGGKKANLAAIDDVTPPICDAAIGGVLIHKVDYFPFLCGEVVMRWW